MRGATVVVMWVCFNVCPILCMNHLDCMLLFEMLMHIFCVTLLRGLLLGLPVSLFHRPKTPVYFFFLQKGQVHSLSLIMNMDNSV